MITSGELCVTMAGALKRLRWSADNWVFKQLVSRYTKCVCICASVVFFIHAQELCIFCMEALTLVRDPVEFFYKTWLALVMSSCS